MTPTQQEQSLEHLERLLQHSLGRKITPREKFYLALAEACAVHNREYKDSERQPQEAA
jgi:hypothetical protein